MSSDPSTATAPPGTSSEVASDLTAAFALVSEMTRDLALAADTGRALERSLGTIARQLRAAAGSLWLFEEASGELVCRASIGEHSLEGHRLPLDRGVMARSFEAKTAERIADAARDADFNPLVSRLVGGESCSMLFAPMLLGEQPLGAIQLVNRTDGGCFGDDDLGPLQLLASSAALALSNARMAASLVEHREVWRDVELAAEIQRSLLPAPRQGPFPVQGRNIPARTVSGDFFDILSLDDGSIGFCLGDVSGKGVNAAILMAKSASLYRYLARTIREPSPLFQALNRELCDTSTRGMFVTMVAGIFEPERGIVRLANAGHEPPLVHDGGHVFEEIPAGAPPLGVVPDGFFPEVALDLAGGSLYVFSDGLTEATCAAGQPLGSEGVRRLVTQHAALPIAERVEAILAAVGALSPRDDLTLLSVCGAGKDCR
jgi:sigma-B regulation protein RsbU (phosphoserine phosphatase)